MSDPTFPPFDDFSGELTTLPAPQQVVYSIESESSVLGGLLMDNAAWELVGDLLHVDDFYRGEHQTIWSAISALINAGNTADVITVFEYLKDRRQDERVGGIFYLNQLAQYVPSTSNIQRYAQIIREKSVKRRLLKAADSIIQDVNQSAKPVVELLDSAEASISAIGEQNSAAEGGFKSSSMLAVDFLNVFSERLDNPVEVTGLSTGYADLDKITSGLQGGDLVILAARPSMGKTTFAMNIAEHVALAEGLPTAIFSLEMSAGQLMTRLVSAKARVDQRRMQQGKVEQDEIARVTEAVEYFTNDMLHINDEAGITVATIRSQARRLARQMRRKLGLVVVDYLQLIGSATGSQGGSDNRATELGDISRGLKMLAKEMDCPVIALSQLNRSVEQRADKRPMMSDLRESGAIEQDADIIAFIYRDDYYNKDSREPNVAEIIIAKQRNGPTGTVKMYFEKAFARFSDLAPASSEY